MKSIQPLPQYSVSMVRPPVVTLVCLVFVLLVVEMEKEVVLPALPDVLKALSISYSLTQAILYINFVGFCCSCLFAGALTRRLGYQRLIHMMSILFCIGSLLTCYFASIESIIVGRFLQGVAGSMLFITMYALVAMLYHGAEATKLLGYVNGVTCFMTAGGPLIGAFLVTLYGWQSCFISIALLSAVGYVATRLAFRHGKAAFTAVAEPMTTTLEENGYVLLLTNGEFLRFALVPAFMCASYMVCLSFLPFFLIEQLHLGRLYYGVYQALVLLAFSIPCFFSGRIGEWMGAKRAERWGTLASGVLGIIYGGALLAGYLNPLTLGVIAVLLFGAQGVPYSNYMSYSIAVAPGHEALASALGMFFRLGFSAVGIWASSSLSGDIVGNVGLVLVVLNAGALVAFMIRGRKK